mgnify:CR=1 FL=1
MSKILVDTIDTRSGTTTLTLGSSNAGTIALGSGDVQSNFLYPAFQARLVSNQSLSNNTHTKMEANSENFDTDSCYDTSNYRFTPTKAGEYLCYGQVNIAGGTIGNLGQISLRKNGSTVVYGFDRYAGDGDIIAQVQNVINFNGSSDYLEVFIRQTSGSTKEAFASYSFFGAYRIGT